MNYTGFRHIIKKNLELKKDQKTKSLRTSVSTRRTRAFALIRFNDFTFLFLFDLFYFTAIDKPRGMLLKLCDSLRQMMQVTLVYPTDITENANVADVEGFLREVRI